MKIKLSRVKDSHFAILDENDRELVSFVGCDAWDNYQISNPIIDITKHVISIKKLEEILIERDVWFCFFSHPIVAEVRMEMKCKTKELFEDLFQCKITII